MPDGDEQLPTHEEVFPSAWAKVERAERHREELDKVLEEWQASEPLVSETVLGDDAAVFRVRVRSKLPRAVPCIVGDLVHNLRAALDHAVYTCVGVPDADTCQFPTWRDPDPAAFTRPQWVKRVKTAVPVADGVAGTGATKLREALRMLDPFPGGEHDFLWVLSYLDNVDKHRLVLSVTAAVNAAVTTAELAITTDAARWVAENADTKGYDFVEVPTGSSGEPIFKDAKLHLELAPSTPFPLTDGQEVLRYTGPGWRSLVEAGMEFAVVLGEPERYAGSPLQDHLNVMTANTATMLRFLANRISSA